MESLEKYLSRASNWGVKRWMFVLGCTFILLLLPILAQALLKSGAPRGTMRLIDITLYVLDFSRSFLAVLIFIAGTWALPSPRQARLRAGGLVFLAVGSVEIFNLFGGVESVLQYSLSAASGRELALSGLSAALSAIAICMLTAWPGGKAISKINWALMSMGLVLGLAVTIDALENLQSLPLAPRDYSLGGMLCGASYGVIALAILLSAFGRLRHDGQQTSQNALFAASVAVASSAIAAGLPLQTHGPRSLGIEKLFSLISYVLILSAIGHDGLLRPLKQLAKHVLRERMILAASPDGVVCVDEGGIIRFVNPALLTMSGYSETELVGKPVEVLMEARARSSHFLALDKSFSNSTGRPLGRIEVNLAKKDASTLPVDICFGIWRDDDRNSAIAYIRDLSEKKGYERSLQHRATHDLLTELPNRWLFNKNLEKALGRSERLGGLVVVLFLDLDNFKSINDTFGHGAGDSLLIEVSRRLSKCLRSGDTLARLGGDEFAILLVDVSSHSQAVQVAVKLLDALSKPYRLGSYEVLSGASIGLAFAPDDALDGEDLLRCADVAMYQAKRSGRNTYALYSADLNRDAQDNHRIHVRLKEALDGGRLRLHFQPQVHIATGLIVGAEALLRWNDEILGHVSPAKFIPVAEATGLILPITDWVIKEACRQLSNWSARGLKTSIAINVSAHSFRRDGFAERVAAEIKRWGLSGSNLEIEVTETVAMSQPELTGHTLNALARLGCRISLDDFGTGYSSLAYLKALPVSKIKIDRQFIKDITTDSNDLKITGTIIALANAMDITVIAEGVETTDQLALLKERGCDLYQGWLFSKALPADDFCALVARYESDAPSEGRVAGPLFCELGPGPNDN